MLDRTLTTTNEVAIVTFFTTF